MLNLKIFLRIFALRENEPSAKFFRKIKIFGHAKVFSRESMYVCSSNPRKYSLEKLDFTRFSKIMFLIDEIKFLWNFQPLSVYLLPLLGALCIYFVVRFFI